MEKPNETVLRESAYIALGTVILCILMNAVFWVLRLWNLPVLWGTLLGGGAAACNFFLMALTVQKAVQDADEKAMRMRIRASQALRFVALFTAAALGAALPVFNTIAALLPLFFPRLVIALQPLFERLYTARRKKKENNRGDAA